MATRTHTTYFNDDSLAELRKHAAELRENFDKRAPYIEDDARYAGNLRLTILEHAITLLGEPVPPSFGG